MQNKEIEKDKKSLKEFAYTMYGTLSAKEAKNILQYIDKLENKVKELGRGQHTLMQSRRKWKNRYYKERRKRKETDKVICQIYEDYQDIGNMYFDLNEKVQNTITYLKDTSLKCYNDTENENLSDWEKSISRAVGSELVKILNKLEDKEKRKNVNK